MELYFGIADLLFIYTVEPSAEHDPYGSDTVAG